MARADIPPMITAREAGKVGCRMCGRAADPSEVRCPLCGAALQSRDAHSLQKVWAWWIAGLIAYVPANLYPMMLITQFFRKQESTIVGGVIDLIHHHEYAIAIIVFVASIAIPVGKFVVIAYLASVLRRPHQKDAHRLLTVYEIVEFIGRWSMIDVFVVAILAALVQFNILATINPGIAAVCFALSVIFTMLSAQSFDSRMIWDRLERTTHDRRASAGS